MRFAFSKSVPFLVAVVALLGLGLVVPALAGEDVAPAPTAKPAAERPATDAPSTEPEVVPETTPAVAKPETTTPSPVHSILFWVAARVTKAEGEACCPTTDGGATAWRAWFDGGADVPLADLRDALVRDGWNADRTIAWFAKQAAAKGGCGDCSGKAGCEKGACEKGGCEKGPCGDKGSCGGCPDKGTTTEQAPTSAPAGDTTEAGGAEQGGCCGRCKGR